MPTSNIKNVGFSDYSAEQASLLRRQKMAEMLMQEGQEPFGQTETIGGWAMPRSPWEYAGKAAKVASGAYQQYGVNERTKALAERMRTETGEDWTKYQGMRAGTPARDARSMTYEDVPETPDMLPAIPGDPQAANNWLAANARNPTLQQLGWAQALKGEEPYTLGEGQTRFGAGNQPLATGGPRTFAPPAPPKPLLPAQKVRTRIVGDQQIQEELQDDGTWKQIGTGPRFAKQVGPTIVNPTPPVVQTDQQGNVRFYDRSGNLIKEIGAVGKPSATFEKTAAANKKLERDLTTAIAELERATADGGLIDQSTGSGIGAGIDWMGRLVGQATPGAIAVGSMKPIYDLVLKMVPRFEGPQSDKDTASYEAASGTLANPNVPNAQKKAAGKEILRLMRARKGQFVSKDMEGTEVDQPKPAGNPHAGKTDEQIKRELGL